MNDICLTDYATTSDEHRIALFCEKSDKLNLTFNISVQFKIEGVIEPDIFKEALFAVTERHESMQLTFFKKAEKIFKSVEGLSLEILPFFYHDFSKVADSRERIHDVYTNSLNSPFNVYKEAPWRYHLCKIENGVHIGILTAHHLIGDFNSALIIGKELQCFYDSLSTGSSFHFQSYSESDLQAIEESASFEDPFFDRYKEDIIEEVAGIQDLSFTDRKLLFHERTFELDNVLFNIPEALRTQVNKLALKEEISELVVYLSAFQIAIQELSSRDEFVIGLPVNIRPGKRFRGAVGYLSKPMFLPVEFKNIASYRDLVSTNISKIKKSARRRYFPIGRLAEQLAAEKATLPKINVLFNYLDCRYINDPSCDTSISVIPKGFTHSSMDLWLTVQREEEATVVKLEYSKDIFETEQLNDFNQLFLDTVSAICANYENPIHKATAEKEELSDVLITGTFTLDPIENALAEFAGKTKLLPYHQVMQTLLNADMSGMEHATCISILFRLADFFKHGKSAEISEKEVAEFCTAFVQAISFSIANKNIKHQLIFCPVESSTTLLETYSDKLLKELKEIDGLSVEDLEGLSETSIYNAQTNEVAHIPYAIPFYNKLAFFISKHHYQSKHPVPKVIVLDCDNTLWRGVIGEDGLDGIEISPAFQAFQRKLLVCHEQGILLALASKNNEAEVLAVFDTHPDMILTRDHIVAHKINWNPKCQSILELQEALNLGLDSFLFVDDNPVEVDQCSTQVPEMLSVLFPKEESAILNFAQYHWSINYHENKSSFNRTQAYKQETVRQNIKQELVSVEDYIAALDMRVNFIALGENNMDRASQLTLRTNQFNLIGEKLTVPELSAQITSGARSGMLINAEDKYGDYGIIGLILYRYSNHKMVVENTMLSCRVLGRGLEFHLCQWILEMARSQTCKSIRFEFRDTGRNLPGFQFLKALSNLGDLDSLGLSISLKNMEQVRPATFIHKSNCAEKKRKTIRPKAIINRISEANDLAHALNVFKQQKADTEEILFDNEVLSRLWLNATYSTELIPDMSFSDHGGSSLECVFLLTEINNVFKIDLTIDELYANDTFQKLNLLIESKLKIGQGDTGQSDNRLAVFLKDMELSYEDVPFQQSTIPQRQTESELILLTGATGFVGIHILKELLQQHVQTEVVCLIRSSDAQDGKNRLIKISEEYKVYFSAAELSRVRCISGDLGRSGLGISSDQWSQLSQTLTRIVHCGAKVNFFDNYERLKQVNVDSTRDLLKLTSHGKPKKFVYISTIGVFHSEQNVGLKRFEENFATGSPDLLPTGYQQSKWVSEKLVSRAMERGVHAQVIRLGVIAGNPNTESMNLSDVFVHFLASIYKMGAIPQMRDMDFTPVDFAAKAIAKISEVSDTSGGIYNLVSPKPISVETLALWAKMGGDKLELLPYSEWKNKLDVFFENNPTDTLVKYSPLFRGRNDQSSFIEILLKAPIVSTAKTDAILSKNGLVFPDISQEMLMQYQSSYISQELIVPDSSKEIRNQNNLFWIVEEMNGYVQQQAVAKLNDADYFAASAKGKEAGQSFRIDFKGHVKSLVDLMTSKKVHLNGQIYCPAIDANPLEVQEGVLTISPFEGYAPGRKDSLIFLTYEVQCISSTGIEYIMNGYKVSSNVPNMFYELTQVLFTIKEKKNPATQWVGVIEIPFQQLFRDQVNLMTFREGLSDKEKLKCQSAWMGILMMNSMKNYMNITLRDNPIDWNDLYAFAKSIPRVESMINGYMKQLGRLKKFGFLSKMADFQFTNWFKKKTI
ncbi:MAG: thioester reductase domain-containing protein [Saprospiraceae bacterium]|nr:thioester reductase domain-containing protein [Saprospiraceae bacterium]